MQNLRDRTWQVHGVGKGFGGEKSHGGAEEWEPFLQRRERWGKREQHVRFVKKNTPPQPPTGITRN